MNFIFRAEILNAFNTPWFTPVTGHRQHPDDYLVTDATRAGRQLVFRVNFSCDDLSGLADVITAARSTLRPDLPSCEPSFRLQPLATLAFASGQALSAPARVVPRELSR